MEDVQISGAQDASKGVLNKRMEGIAWGLIFVITGVAFLIPGWAVPWATWLVGIGLVMLGLNVVRYRRGVKVRWFTTVLGLLALTAGVGNFAGLELELPLLSAFFILIGAGIILKPVIRDRR